MKSSSSQILLPEEYLGTTLNDLTSKRRAQIIEISTQDQDHVISAYIPLSSVIVSIYEHICPTPLVSLSQFHLPHCDSSLTATPPSLPHLPHCHTSLTATPPSLPHLPHCHTSLIATPSSLPHLTATPPSLPHLTATPPSLPHPYLPHCSFFAFCII